jgi:hypothetical protein
MTGVITAESQVGETIAHHPGTGPILMQGGRLYVSKPGNLYATYPVRTIGEYATASGLAIEPLLGLLNAAAESEQSAQHTASRSGVEHEPGGWRERAPPIGALGYTGSYREHSGDIEDVSVVSVLEARGPE